MCQAAALLLRCFDQRVYHRYRYLGLTNPSHLSTPDALEDPHRGSMYPLTWCSVSFLAI